MKTFETVVNFLIKLPLDLSRVPPYLTGVSCLLKCKILLQGNSLSIQIQWKLIADFASFLNFNFFYIFNSGPCKCFLDSQGESITWRRRRTHAGLHATLSHFFSFFPFVKFKLLAQRNHVEMGVSRSSQTHPPCSPSGPSYCSCQFDILCANFLLNQ